MLFLISVMERCTVLSHFLLFSLTWFRSRFLYELSQIPNFADRAHCIIFRSAFIDGVASIKRKLNTVSSVCEVGVGFAWFSAEYLSNTVKFDFTRLVFEGFTGQLWREKGSGTSSGSGEPHERRQQGQRSG